ncbi:MAG: Kelch repeat-containing protein [Geitlerinemataceae cyanobacterium]
MVSITQTLENITLPRRLWKTGAPLPTPLLESAATVRDRKLYVFGGFTFGWKATRNAYAYHFDDDRWETLPDLPTPVTHVNAVVNGDDLWIAGGFVGNHPGKATTEVWRFSFSQREWHAAPPLPEPRAGGGLSIINGALHYFGGFGSDRDSTHDDHWFLPFGDSSWQPAPPLPEIRGHISAIAHGNKIYSIGGQIRHDTNPVDRDSVFCFDGATNQWQQCAAMPAPRSHFEATTFAIEDYIFIAGGRNNQNPVLVKSNPLDHKGEKLIDDFPLQLFLTLKSSSYRSDLLPSILVYDTRRDRWIEGGALPTRLYGPVANVVDRCAIVSGGSRIRHSNVQTRTLLNESLIDLVLAKASRPS